jgi:hypothetical protein
MISGAILVGIVGVGRIAVDAHIPDLRKAGAEVFALADVAPGRAGRFAAQFEVPHAFDDCRAMLKRDVFSSAALRGGASRHLDAELQRDLDLALELPAPWMEVTRG